MDQVEQILQNGAQFSNAFHPYLLLLGAILWLYRVRRLPAVLALIGCTLIASNRLAHMLGSDYKSDGFIAMKPNLPELIRLVWLFGATYGALLLSIALIFAYAVKPRET